MKSNNHKRPKERPTPVPNNFKTFEQRPVTFDSERGIGCEVNPTTGDNITVIPTVECVLTADLCRPPFPQSPDPASSSVLDSLVAELMRQFIDTYPVNERHTFLARSQYEESVNIWPDCNRGPKGMTFTVAFVVPQLCNYQFPELCSIVQDRVFFAVAQMLVTVLTELTSETK